MSDELAILDTYSRYAQAHADRRWDDWADQFTDDTSLTNNLGTFHGRDEVRAMIAERFAGDSSTRLAWCNPVIEVDGDVARRETDYLVFGESETADGLALQSMGRYEDVFRKEGGRWRIHERRAVRAGG